VQELLAFLGDFLKVVQNVGGCFIDQSGAIVGSDGITEQVLL